MTDETHAILDGIESWVAVESKTEDRDGVNAVMSLAEQNFIEAGARVRRIPGTNGLGDHLVASSPWGGDGPGILVLCHLDTVHPRGTLSNGLRMRVDGDRAYGPGIYDMKGGAYLAYWAMKSIIASDRTPALPVRIIYAADEEIGSPTSRSLIEAEADNAKYVLVTEPARDGGKIVTGRKGVGRYEMRAFGRPAHSGARHELGRSAIREIARQVETLEALTDYERGLTVNIGQIRGGTADNVVPAECWAAIDVRMKTPADAEWFDRHVKSLKPVGADIRLEVNGALNRPPYEKSAAVEELFAHAKGLAREIGFDLVDTSTGGGSDGNFTAHKVPTLDGLGVDGDGAHTLQEHLLVSSLVPRMLLQKRLMETLQ